MAQHCRITDLIRFKLRTLRAVQAILPARRNPVTSSTLILSMVRSYCLPTSSRLCHAMLSCFGLMPAVSENGDEENGDGVDGAADDAVDLQETKTKDNEFQCGSNKASRILSGN